MTKKNICILTFTIGKSGLTPLSNFIDILSSMSKNLYLITGNEGYRHFKSDKRLCTYGFFHKKNSNPIIRFCRYFYSQIKISYFIIKIQKSIDVFILTIGGDTLLLPIITAKILRKKVVLAFAGSSALSMKFSKDRCFIYMELLSQICVLLSNKIVLYTTSNIQNFNLQKYKDKIIIAPKHFLNFNKYFISKKYSERENLVGYVGRFTEEKGVMNFVESIPLILKHTNINFLLIGDGQLHEEIENYIVANNLTNNVETTGWIEHNELPEYINKLKLIVLPSYTEGLPNLMLEAMACGTPILATPVGSIPDLIIDEKTGFIMKENDPKCISYNVIRVLDNSDLDMIIYNARNLIEQEFTYEAAVERYKILLENL